MLGLAQVMLRCCSPDWLGLPEKYWGGYKSHGPGCCSSPVQNTGLSNVSFKAGDVHQLEADSNFDAVTGRLILFHLKDPAVVLRKLVTYLKPGGLAVFQDYNLGALASYPASDLLEQIKRWVIEAFLTAGADPFVGLKLGAIFQEAGLRRPQMICEASIGAELAWEGYDQIALVTRALLPVLVESGLASAEEVGIDTLAERLRQDVAGKGGVGRGPDVISAWTRLS